MDINSEFGEIAQAKENGGSNYIDKPQVLIVSIKDVKLSEPNAEKPFMEVVFEAEDKRTSSFKFFRAKAGDSESAKETKLSMIKSLFSNAGIDLSKTPGDVALKAIIGKKVKALFREKEYSGKDKNDNMRPVIKKIVEYAWCGALDKNIVSSESQYYKKLSPAEMEKHNGKVQDWARANATPSTGAAQAATQPDDLPF